MQSVLKLKKYKTYLLNKRSQLTRGDISPQYAFICNFLKLMHENNKKYKILKEMKLHVRMTSFS